MKEFIIQTNYFCQWEHGAKEYFNTLKKATDHAKNSFVRTPTMTDSNYEYWLKQKYIIGKEITIIQELKTITNG